MTRKVTRDTINEDQGVNGNCVNAVRMLQQTNYTDPASRVPGDVGNRQWFYQTCTQFGWYQSSDQTGGRYKLDKNPFKCLIDRDTIALLIHQ